MGHAFAPWSSPGCHRNPFIFPALPLHSHPTSPRCKAPRILPSFPYPHPNRCEDGYYNDPDQGDCLPCAASLGAACSWCGLDTTAGDPGVPTCFGCVEGYEFDDASSKCVSAPS